MNRKKIILKNVRVHNLKGVHLELEPGQLIAFTGVSGSGKSSLAFDTIYVEGQRRYVESLSTYARRHLGHFHKPDADLIEGLSPSIAIEQKTIGKNPRSTVGTLTGLYDFLRVLFARVSTPYCPVSQEPVSAQSARQILDEILLLPEGSKLILLAPYASAKKGEFKEEFSDLLRKGFTKIRLDGVIVDLARDLSLDGSVSHDIDLVIDRIVLSFENEHRLTESVQAGLEQGKGLLKILMLDTKEERFFSEHAYSKTSGLSYGPLEPSDFSFNHPSGMCPSCQGLGTTQAFDLSKVLDEDLSIAEDCCKVASSFSTIRYGNIYSNLARIYRFDIHTPWKNLSQKAKDVFLYGTQEKWTKMRFTHPEKGNSWTEYVCWKGVLSEAKERYAAAQSDLYRKKMEEYFHEAVCETCKGSRLKPYPSAARLMGKKIADISSMTLEEARLFFSSLSLPPEKKTIAEELVKEIISRLFFLEQVGLSYLSLDRTAPTLSGGEGQRVRLASQIGSGLIGSTYILDEPSIGLHPRDNHRLLQTLIRLKEKGNTVIVVEHDEETILAADSVVDVGPLAGKKGGKILVQGTIEDLLNCKESLTGGYLSGRLSIQVPKKRRKSEKGFLSIEGATHHNLKNVSLKIPLGLFVAITGVSGSGKSSLIIDTLYPVLSNALHGASLKVGSHKAVRGQDLIDKIIAIDQDPIGRTPRSNPATYVKLFDEIRDLFALLPESQAQGFDVGRFSFNVKEGCCPFCTGMGMVKIDMDFMEDEWVTCEHCEGKRFDEATLNIRFKDKSIHDVLEMTVLEASEFFSSLPKIKKKLDLLLQVGLDYIKLGQPSPTLSGGEAQRIKLAKELSRPSTGKTLYILDEPTTGLHFHDINHLMLVLHSLVEKGNTVVVIEHNMDLVKTADWVIDLGPEAGSKGGEIVGEGTPEKIAKMDTPTGVAIKHILSKKIAAQRPSFLPSEPQDPYLVVQGAHQNNLQGVDARIPLGKITVCTGPSGSGKSSLAFETIYAEGQRRYTESMSHYARQFVKQMPKPKVDRIEGLSAAIAIEQKSHAGNPRSTIGTMTEIYDYLRLIYCHLGTAFCPETGEEIRSISKEYVIEKAMSLPLKTKLFVLSQVTLGKSETFEECRQRLLKQGFLRIRLNKTYFELEEEIPFDKKKKNELFLVVDRIVLGTESRGRIGEAIEQATTLSKNSVVLATEDKDLYFNLAFTVESTGKSYPPITPHTFSFNTEQGMCLECTGLGIQYGADLAQYKDLLELSAHELFFLLCKDFISKTSIRLFLTLLSKEGINPDTPLQDLSKKELSFLLQGDPSPSKESFSWKGFNEVLIQYTKTSFSSIRWVLSRLLEESPCHACNGSRLSPIARHVKIEGLSIADLCLKSIDETFLFLRKLKIPLEKKLFLDEIFSQTLSKLEFLRSIGLGYLSLERSAPTLSGGETQRIRLSRQLGSGLTGCLYVLDEPTIGLHPHDNHLLNQALQKLKELGNTLVLVEHDPLTIQMADYLLDFGPGAGKFGGHIIAEGPLEKILYNPDSLTGAYLSGRKKIPLPPTRKKPSGFIELSRVCLHNIKDLSVSIPRGVLCCFTGVSGSGKSTLVMDILKPAAEKVISIKRKKQQPSPSWIKGLEAFDKLIVLEQNPIGTTIRADISTYTDLLTPLRHLYASLPEAKARGLIAKHFSFNHKKGMCKACFGLGTKTVSLQFLPSIQVECDSCKGYRLNPLSLQVRFKEKNLGEVLQLSVLQAKEFFSSIPKVYKILEALCSVGLDYLTLGQEIATLSGGEGQRLRLSKELAKRSTGKTLYLLDEPSVGLHSSDIARLVPILHSLTDKGNTILLIEHNLDLIASSDYLIDMGPGAGSKGGSIVFEGTPEDMTNCLSSKTAVFLKEHLDFLKHP
jgi:excinuclease ABC subunit A